MAVLGFPQTHLFGTGWPGDYLGEGAFAQCSHLFLKGCIGLNSYMATLAACLLSGTAFYLETMVKKLTDLEIEFINYKNDYNEDKVTGFVCSHSYAFGPHFWSLLIWNRGVKISWIFC